MTDTENPDSATPDSAAPRPPSTAAKAKETFIPDYRIAWLSTLGFLGLLFAFIVLAYPDLFCKDTERKSIFHEVSYHPRVIAGQAILFLQDSLRSAVKSDTQRLAIKALATDSVALLKAKIAVENAHIITLDAYRRYYEDASLNDSLAFNKLTGLLHFDITPDTIVNWDTNFVRHQEYAWTAPVKYWLKINTPNGPLIHSGKTVFGIDRFSSNIQFMEKYPAVGTWVFLIAVFCSFCAIAISTSIITKQRVFSYFKSRQISSPPKRAFFVAWALIFAALGILRFISDKSFDDETPVKALFFMKNFTTSIDWIYVLGYVTGAGCLAGFIRSASMLGYFANSIKNKTKEIVKQRKTLTAVTKPAARQKEPGCEEQLSKMEDTKAKFHEAYDRLQSYFNTYFMLSAVILSLLVFCTGSLFSAVNSLDFVKLLSANWGYSPAGADIMYLYGGVYTVILLLIYLPARLQFNEIQLELPPSKRPVESTGTPATKTNLLDMIADPLGRMKGILLAASPLLASVIQSLFDLLFKH